MSAAPLGLLLTARTVVRTNDADSSPRLERGASASLHRHFHIQAPAQVPQASFLLLISAIEHGSWNTATPI